MANYKDYMPATTSRTRERIEWSISYTFGATDEASPRVLLIGDSICNGYQSAVRERLTGKANVGFWASSKCVTDRDYFRELDFILGGYDCDFISFNNGLHSLTTDRDEWEAAYRSAVKFILAKMPSAKLSLTLCTALNNVEKNETVKVMNAITRKIADELSLPVVDLFTPMDALDKDANMGDVFHYRAPAIAIQADILRDHIASQITLAGNVTESSTETGPDGRLG